MLARSASDVVWAVRAAAGAGQQVSVRSGGHSWYGNCLRDGAVMVDVSRLDGIEIDAAAMTASVGPGTTGAALDAALLAHGLFFPIGHCGSVGLGGFTLGGGYGWNSRAAGPACMNLRALDVVLAGGELVHADDETHPELMWAARGCGPGFLGVVTRLVFDLRPRPRMLRIGDIYPLDVHDELLTWALATLPTLPAELEVSIRVGYSELAGCAALTLTGLGFASPGDGHAGDPVELLAPLRACPVAGRVLQSFTVPIERLPDLHDRGVDGPAIRWDVDGIWTDAPAAEILPAARAAGLGSVPAGHSFVLWMLWGGYPQRPDACWSVQAPLYLSPNAGWEDPADDERHIRWVDGALQTLAPYSRGVQFSDANLAARPGQGLSAGNALRLEEIRGRYDPDGLFCSYMTPDQERERSSP